MEKKLQKPYLANYNFTNLVDKFAEGIYEIKCKNKHDNKKCEACGIKYKDCNCFLGYTNVKDNLILNKCLRCNKNYQKKVW